jgi:hypothetical protein
MEQELERQMIRKTAIGAAAVMALALAPGAALAQDDMADDDMMMGSMVPHPSHIHTGDCSAIGDVIAPLSDVGVVGNDAQGAAHVHVDIGLTTVDRALDDIIATDHSIVVHDSADNMGTFIVCGGLGGHDVDGSFLVGLGPVADSGFSGIAWLTDNGDGTTDVSVTISNSGATESMGAGAMAMDDDMDSDDMDSDDMDDDMDDDE